jgi:hypothetical protein
MDNDNNSYLSISVDVSPDIVTLGATMVVASVALYGLYRLFRFIETSLPSVTASEPQAA